MWVSSRRAPLRCLAKCCAILAAVVSTTATKRTCEGDGGLRCNTVVNSTSTGRKTCVVNGTASAPSLSLSFAGDIHIAFGAVLTATQGSLWIQAEGGVTFEGNTTASAAEGDIVLDAAGVLLLEGGASLKAGGNVSIVACAVRLEESTAEAHGNLSIASPGVLMTKSASIVALKVFVLADPPSLPSTGQSALRRNECISKAPAVSADAAAVTLSSSVTATEISIFVSGNVDLESAALHGVPEPGNTDDPGISVIVTTQGNVSMDLNGGQWNTRLVAVQAGAITMRNQTIRTRGTSCQNRRAAKLDECAQVLEQRSWPMPSANESAEGAANLTFDLRLVARSSLQLRDVQIFAGSMLVCSGAQLELKAASLDASGRGCGPGEGVGKGDVGGEDCGAGGGGSHVGRGGWGATYDTAAVTECAAAGKSYGDYNVSSTELPTQAASGGGCGFEWPCPLHDSIASPASGGGLIWVSSRDVSLQGGVEMNADGNPGVAANLSSSADVSGGGAGGHILLWVYGDLAVDADRPTRLTVKGGDIQCSKRRVSGAGGGGFVGIQYSGADSIPKRSLKLSFAGGSMLDECLGWPPQAGLASTYGQPGVAVSLAACPAGHAGPFCQLCPAGSYANGSSECLLCNNKPPEHSQYTSTGWPNSTCPYKCAAGVPDYRTNPKCLPASSFVFQFFGGLGGALVILACLILVSGFFLCRRSRHRMRQNSSKGESEGGLLRRWCSACVQVVSCCYRTQDTRQQDGELIFTKEQLPFHVCRVYLYGQNNWQFPWGISNQIPAILQSLVAAEQWEILAYQVNTAAEVPSRETLYAVLLGLVNPPFVAPLGCWQRQRRARLLQRCVRHFSEGSSGCALFWKPIRARVHSAGELAMVFGCDRGATLGYLDFFDFSRSQMDWAPVDLRQEARLLVAHGQGTYADPFTLDMGDPLVAHLAQSDFGAVAVCSIISTFNRISRSIEMDEIGRGSRGLKVLRLRQKVEQCAAQCGLSGFVQVLAFQQLWASSRCGAGSPNMPRTDSDNSFLDLMPRSAARSQGSSAQRQLLPEAPSGAGTLSTLVSPPAVRTVQMARVSPANRLRAMVPAASRGLEVKLCLAFIDPSVVLESPAALSPSRPAQGVLLTSPMARTALGEHLEQGGNGALTAIAEASSLALHSSGSWLERWRLLSCREKGSATPATVLVMVVVLLFTDLLAFIIVGASLLRISRVVCALWILVPPLVQPLALILGPLFLLSECPRLGRLYASLSLWGTVSVTVSTVALLAVQQVDSWFFTFVELLIVWMVKVAASLVANVHIRNLEAAWDMSFMDAPQADFLGHILSAESSRQFSTASYEYEHQLFSRGGTNRPLDDLAAERGVHKPGVLGPSALSTQRTFRSGLGSSGDSFLQPGTYDETSADTGVTLPTSRPESFRHSSGRSWEMSLGSSSSEPSPF